MPMVRAVNAWLVPGVFILGVIAYVTIYANGWARTPIRSDGLSYYVYLPAVVLHQDPGLAALADDCCGGRFPEYTGLARLADTGHWLNPHPIGVAVLMLPFFLIAHALTLWSNFTPDGFSVYYQHAAGLSGIVWMTLGLRWLQRGLARDFHPGVVAGTLLAVTFGTNLFHYGTYDAVYSHVYSCALIAALLVIVPRWFDDPSLRRSALLGLVAGGIVLVRHANALVLLYPLLYGVGVTDSISSRLRFARSHIGAIATVVCVGLATIAPQIALYKSVTGFWFSNPYGEQTVGFNFSSPHVLEVLFSTQKGLFFWSPVLLVAVAGLMVMRGRPTSARGPIVAVLALTTWIVASWGDWQLGGSYGHRGFTDLLPLFALGFASASAFVSTQRTQIRYVTGGAAGLLVLLSVFQMLQYWWGLVPFNDTTWAQYQELFLRWR
jgi:hypothetical protein